MKVDLDNSVNKYTLRTKSLLKRIESEKTRDVTKKKEPKEKQKPPPLSKYRRKTANARERNRMREINEAFETLQKTLPHLPGADADKLTKITVLRLAVNYIKILSCVIDDDVIVPQDIDELKEMWCLKNAHMAKPEHCVKSVFRSNKLTQSPINKPTKVVGIRQKHTKTKSTSNKAGEPLKDKNGNVIKKRSSKSHRTRGKVCKTASVATSNGAYITLKNVAFQNPASRRTHLDNRPLMMSMTVKRPRLEPMSYQRPPKFSRYEPPVPHIPKSKTQPVAPILTNNKISNYNYNISNSNNIFNNITAIKKDIDPLPPLMPFTLLPPETRNSIDNKYLSSFTIYDLDSPVVKNDVALEYPKNNHHISTMDSTLSCSDDSILSSPKSPLSFTFTGTGSCSPANSSRSFNSVSPSSFTFSDSDSVLAPSAELESLLGPEPFEEELDHLASTFIEVDDDPLSLFFEHATSNFCASDINSY